MDLTTAITTFGGVVTSVSSSLAAALAWKAKLHFADEFKEARDAEVKAAQQMVSTANAQKDAEIQQIKVEIIKREVEIERLKVKIENLEQETSVAVSKRFQEMKSAYESMMIALPKPGQIASEEIFGDELNRQKDIFETHLNALGNEISWMAKVSQEESENRKVAKRWLDTNSDKLARGAFNYTRAKYPGLTELCISHSQEFGLRVFFWDIEQYLEAISDCLVVNRANLIDRIYPALSLPEPYRIAFSYIKRQIPENLPDNVSMEIKKLLDHSVSCIDQYFH